MSYFRPWFFTYLLMCILMIVQHFTIISELLSAIKGDFDLEDEEEKVRMNNKLLDED